MSDKNLNNWHWLNDVFKYYISAIGLLIMCVLITDWLPCHEEDKLLQSIGPYLTLSAVIVMALSVLPV